MDRSDPTRVRGAKQHPRASIQHRGARRSDRAVSLRLELDTLRAAAEGARVLADLVRDEQAGTAHDYRVAPGACSAVLSLVTIRMRLLDAVLAGDTSVQLLAPHNETRPTGDERDDGDILLPADRSRGRK